MQAMTAAKAEGKLVLDPMPCIEYILDRRILRKKIPDLIKRTAGHVDWSEGLVIQEATAVSGLLGAMRSMLARSDGLLCKPCVACGIPESHEMCLVRSSAGLPPEVCSRWSHW